MTFADIQADLYRRLGLPTSPVSATTTRLNAFINETQQEILSEPGLEVLLRDNVPLASVASRAEYGLAPIISRINTIRDTTNDRILSERSFEWYKAAYPDPSAITGLPVAWVDLGLSAVNLQPSNASELFFSSASASDGATKAVFVEGYRTNGYYQSVNVAMNGVTAVSLGASITDWIQVTKFFIALDAGGATTAAGNITLYEDSGSGTALAVIPAGLSYARYRRIALAPTPAAVYSYTVDFEREITDMAEATDQPVIPARFHRMIGAGVRMKEYEKTDSVRYGIAKADYDRAMRNLKFWIANQAGSANLRGPVDEKPSRLGAWYPSIP